MVQQNSFSLKRPNPVQFQMSSEKKVKQEEEEKEKGKREAERIRAFEEEREGRREERDESDSNEEVEIVAVSGEWLRGQKVEEKKIKEEEKMENEQLYIDKHRNNVDEKRREKTLFDKVRKLREIELQEDSDPEEERQKQKLEIMVYGEKVKKDQQPLIRIKVHSLPAHFQPNKQQKASLENVLIQQRSRDILLGNTTLTFNFKTNSQ